MGKTTKLNRARRKELEKEEEGGTKRIGSCLKRSGRVWKVSLIRWKAME